MDFETDGAPCVCVHGCERQAETEMGSERQRDTEMEREVGMPRGRCGCLVGFTGPRTQGPISSCLAKNKESLIIS